MPLGTYTPGANDRSAQFLLSLMMLMMFLERNCLTPVEDKHALFSG